MTKRMEQIAYWNGDGLPVSQVMAMLERRRMKPMRPGEARELENIWNRKGNRRLKLCYLAGGHPTDHIERWLHGERWSPLSDHERAVLELLRR